MANSRPMRRLVTVLLGVSVLVLPGCFTILVWEDAPSIEAKELTGAEVDESHVLTVEFKCSNDEIERFHYALGSKPLNLTHAGRSSPRLPNRARVLVPPSPPDARVDGDRYVDGGETGLSLSFVGLRIEPFRPSGEIDYVFVPDAGLDWREPSNYGRAALTVPSIALDVVTSPFQLAFFIWYITAGPHC